MSKPIALSTSSNIPSGGVCAVSAPAATTQSQVDETFRLFMSWQKQLYPNAKAFHQLLDTIPSFDQFYRIFEGDKLSQALPPRATYPDFKRHLLFEILDTTDQRHGCSDAFLRMKLALAKDIISTAQKEKDHVLGFWVISSLVKQSTQGETADTEKKKYWKALEEFFIAKPGFMQASDPDVFPGASALVILHHLLVVDRGTQSLPASIRLFSNQELLESIIDRAYTHDPEKAYTLTTELISSMQHADLSAVLHHDPRVDYAKLALQIKTINDARAARVDNKAGAQASPPATTEIIKFLKTRPMGQTTPTAPAVVEDPRALANVTETTLGELKRALDDEVPLNRTTSEILGLDDTGFPSFLRDIKKGLETMLSILPEGSELGDKLESFYYKDLPLCKDLKLEEVKARIVGEIKPILEEGLRSTDIFGYDCASLREAATTIYNKAWNYREPSDGIRGNLRRELPDIKAFFRDDMSWDPESNKLNEQTGNLKTSLKWYSENKMTFSDFGDRFRLAYSLIGDHTPLEAVHAFIDTYLPEVQRHEPNFTINLESTHNWETKIKYLQTCLRNFSMKQPDYRMACSSLQGFCERYLRRDLNDQTFIDEVQRYCDNLYRHRGEIDEAMKVLDLLAMFRQLINPQTPRE